MLPIVIATLLATLVIPLVRLFAIKSFRNRIGSPVATVLVPLVAIFAYLSILGGLALYAPTILYSIAVPIAFGVLLLLWYSRPGYGSSRGLPPGSLSPFPIGQWTDPTFHLKGFARYGPIFKTSDLHRPEVCIAGIERIREFLAENSDALRPPKYPLGRFIPGGLLRFADPARHKETRPVFQAAIAPSVYLSQQGQIRDRFRQEFAELSRVSVQTKEGVRAKPFIDHALRVILARLFFGIDLTVPESAHFDALLDEVALNRLRLVPRRGVPQLLEEMKHVIEKAAAQSTTPSFASELASIRPGGLSDPYFAYNLIFMFQIGRQDLAGLSQWILKMLADNPKWLEHIRRAPASSHLPMRIVLETLRLVQSEYLLRYTTRDIVFQGYTIPKGWHVRCCVKESHHLSGVFENPTVFNPDRFLGHRFARSEYMPFGAYHQSCLGEHLTVTLAKQFVTELGNRYALHVASDAPQVYNDFHWQPSTQFRVQLLPYPTVASEPLAENKIPLPSVRQASHPCPPEDPPPCLHSDV